MFIRFGRLGARRLTVGAAFLLSPIFLTDDAQSAQKISVSNIGTYQAAYALEDHDLAQSKLAIASTVKTKLGRHWRLTAKTNFEVSGANTGLGTRATFTRLSRPAKLGSDARVELDEFTISRRVGHSQITLGKQVVAWGLLDGIRVTDQFSPVRFRDFILTDYRPERIATWGGRIKSRVSGVGVDIAVSFDPTGTQFAEIGSAFDADAPRNRGGIATAQAGLLSGIPVSVDFPTGVRDATRVGVRLTKQFGDFRVSGQVIKGPSTDSVYELRGLAQGRPELVLVYPDKTLWGASVEVPRGPVVLRFESAYIDNEPQNVKGGALFAQRRLARFITGIGGDWAAPHDVFVNAQLIADYSKGDADILLRHKKEVFATLRVHRDFMQEQLRAQAEYVGTLQDGDGVVRSSVRYRKSDNITLHAGVDVIFGNQDDLLGQFADQDRVWMRTTVGF